MISASGSSTVDNPWLAHTVRIRAITPEIPGVATYHLEFTDSQRGAAYRCQPGQFNMLYVPGVGEAAISVSGHESSDDTWSHSIRTAGAVTGAIERLGVGGWLGLRGPFGVGWPLDECRGKDLVIAAGGIGLAPLRPVIHAILASPVDFGRATLVYGARTPTDLLYVREFAEWQSQGLDVLTTVDRATAEWRSNIGVVPLLLDRLQPFDSGRSILLICGPEVMMRYTVRTALERGISSTQIYLSLERNMQCAVGFCGHCQLGPAFICKDGPVFRYDRIRPYLAVENL